MALTRGSLVVVSTRGAYTGKPRPAVVIQSELFIATHGSVTICPVTTEQVDAPLFRIALPAGERTGLTTASQVMVDKVVSVPRKSVGREIGRCDRSEMAAIDDALRLWLSL